MISRLFGMESYGGLIDFSEYFFSRNCANLATVECVQTVFGFAGPKFIKMRIQWRPKTCQQSINQFRPLLGGKSKSLFKNIRTGRAHSKFPFIVSVHDSGKRKLRSWWPEKR